MTEIAPPPTPLQTSMDRFMEPPAAATSMNGDMEEEEPIYDVSTDDAVDIAEDGGGSAMQSTRL